MKYIIDLPEDQQILFMDGKRISVITPEKGEMNVFDGEAVETNFVKLKPYDESGRSEDGWNLARAIRKMDDPDIEEAFSVSGWTRPIDGVLEMIEYAEACEKYDAWKKRGSEIHIGDEVDRNGIKGVVCWIGEDEVYGFCPERCDENLIVFNWYKNEIQKTGRSFPELAEALEKIKESE